MGSLGAMHGQTCKGMRHQFGSTGHQQLRRPAAAFQRQQRQARLVLADAALAKVPASHAQASKAALEQLRSASIDGGNRECPSISFIFNIRKYWRKISAQAARWRRH